MCCSRYSSQYLNRCPLATHCVSAAEGVDTVNTAVEGRYNTYTCTSLPPTVKSANYAGQDCTAVTNRRVQAKPANAWSPYVHARVEAWGKRSSEASIVQKAASPSSRRWSCSAGKHRYMSGVGHSAGTTIPFDRLQAPQWRQAPKRQRCADLLRSTFPLI